MWLNAFPPKGGVSPTISPRSLISGVPLDFKKHCQLAFGSYAQTHHELDPTNSPNTRTVGAICLGPIGIEPSIEAEVLSDTDPAIPVTFSMDDNDPLTDMFLEPPNTQQPHELFNNPQLANLQDEPPQEIPPMLPFAPDPLPDPLIVEEGVDNDAGWHCSTRARAQPSSQIPSFTGKRYKAAAQLLAQLEPDHAFLSNVTMTQSSVKAGPYKLGNGSSTAIFQELAQLCLHDTFEPLHQMNLLSVVHRSALESHLFLKENCDANVKACMVAGVNKLRSTRDKIASHSPTAVLESVMLTAVINAAEGQNVAIVNIPNAFVQAKLPKSSSKWIKHLICCYFSISDQIIKGYKSIEYCPTTEMIAIFLTKPIQGKLFVKFRKAIMHLPD